ncbi:N-6 DNA methylase [Sphingobium sp.]|uniref:N-6 DNA methylase n=1 Tax=Sphingobium sp. TaxID=1912891 RepID=UPI002C6DF6F0|nr:N-6 DNA methylase [Sphingobium sp.]HUD91315.1 N-6 DNA methylase [Sphingobium sp.]
MINPSIRVPAPHLAGSPVNARTHTPHLKVMRELLQRCQPRHDIYTVFGHCMEAMAIAIANSIDLRARDQREARYLDIVGRYGADVVESFPQVMAELAVALEAGMGDVLGALFHDLELHNKAKGQFFTPYSVSIAMAQMLAGDTAALRENIERRGYLTAMEPACGSGCMVIALADVLRAQGINYQRHLHVTAIDIDPRAVHMAYAQLSLLHVPARLIVGNPLSGEIREQWFTPAHVLGGWTARLASEPRGKSAIETIPNVTAAKTACTIRDTDGAPGRNRPASLPRQLSLF